MALIHKKIIVGPFQCNCSILVCDQTKEAIIIDAGDEGPRIEQELKSLGCKLKYSVHTHAHLDHIGAVFSIKNYQNDSKILLHKADRDLYNNLPMQGKMFRMHFEQPPAVDQFMSDLETFQFGSSYGFQVFHTPGHSPGGVCLHFKEGSLSDKPYLFTGDTLFEESIGRTDLWGGDFGQLKQSIRDRIYTLDLETVVSPGHGLNSTVEHEKHYNPFVTG